MSMRMTDEPGDACTETLELLQEEVARLEDELARLQEAARETSAELDPEPEPVADDPRVEELTAALEERDQTIGLLCEQLAAVEELSVARAAEWEQIDRWVRELEARIESSDATSTVADDNATRETALREQFTCRERAWEAERALLERELGALRSRQVEAAGHGGDLERIRLEAELHRLQDEGRRLATIEAEAEAIRARATDLESQLAQSQLGLVRAEDDIRRQAFEHEAELAALRASLASVRAAAPAELSVDERMRAFRLHLQEVHEREEREREERQLVHRISRLWRRNGPRG